MLQATVALSADYGPRSEDSSRIRQSAGTHCHVRQQRQEAEPLARTCQIPGSWWIGFLWSSPRSVWPSHDRGGGSRTVWHRLQATDEIIAFSRGDGISVERIWRSGPAMRSGYRLVSRKSGLGSDSVDLLVRLRPAYLPERDQRNRRARRDQGSKLTPLTVGDHRRQDARGGISQVVMRATDTRRSLLLSGPRCRLSNRVGPARGRRRPAGLRRPASPLRCLWRDLGDGNH